MMAVIGSARIRALSWYAYCSVTSGNNKLLRRRHGRLSEEAVIRALEQTDGHRASAAQLLGVSERTLYRYVQRLRSA